MLMRRTNAEECQAAVEVETDAGLQWNLLDMKIICISSRDFGLLTKTFDSNVACSHSYTAGASKNIMPILELAIEFQIRLQSKRNKMKPTQSVQPSKVTIIHASSASMESYTAPCPIFHH